MDDHENRQSSWDAAEPVVVWCPECGPDPRCDEDGCCLVCGATVGEVPDWEAWKARAEKAEAEAEKWRKQAQEGTNIGLEILNRATNAEAEAARLRKQLEQAGVDISWETEVVEPDLFDRLEEAQDTVARLTIEVDEWHGVVMKIRDLLEMPDTVNWAEIICAVRALVGEKKRAAARWQALLEWLEKPRTWTLSLGEILKKLSELEGESDV